MNLQIKAVAASVAIIALLTFPQWGIRERLNRALWPPNRDGLTVVVRTARHLGNGANVAAVVERLQSRGVGTVWVQFKQDDSDEVRGGEAFYPSAVAPVAPGYEDDRLGGFVSALKDAGIRVCAWVPCMNDAAAWEANPAWRARGVGENGVAAEHVSWLCPSSDAAVAYETDIVREIVTKYPQLDALYTDFIRYDSDLSCVCERCLARLGEASEAGPPGPMALGDLLAAAKSRSNLWESWVGMRSEVICEAVDSLRDGIEDARPGMWFGACVLPFSATDYSLNTQSGQDYYEMARVGLDELVIMGYWDDWEKSPQWLQDGLNNATKLVKGECELSCLLDGDMSLRRTWVTLDAIRDVPVKGLGYFNYGEWRIEDLERLNQATAASRTDAPPRPEFTAVAIRIDTEPDDSRRYDTVAPEMITKLVDMFDEEGVSATFVTCGRLAELQPDAVRLAAARGHEIACHAYDHEQLDALTGDSEVAAIVKGLDALKAAGVQVVGFGAPRNSLSWAGRDVLIERGIEYDGSAAYDPMTSLMDVQYVGHSSGDGRRIIVVPFVMPNDWDALRGMKLSESQMEEAWNQRLDRVASMGEPVFVLDIHQWLASREDEMDVLRRFIRNAKSRGDCRVMTLRDTAAHARRYLDMVDQAAADVSRPVAVEGSP